MQFCCGPPNTELPLCAPKNPRPKTPPSVTRLPITRFAIRLRRVRLSNCVSCRLALPLRALQPRAPVVRLTTPRLRCSPHYPRVSIARTLNVCFCCALKDRRPRSAHLNPAPLLCALQPRTFIVRLYMPAFPLSDQQPRGSDACFFTLRFCCAPS